MLIFTHPRDQNNISLYIFVFIIYNKYNLQKVS